MNIRSISVSNNTTNSLNNNTKYNHKNLSFTMKNDSEFYMNGVEKLVSENGGMPNCFFDIFNAMTTKLSKVYKQRQTNTPSPFKSSFFIPKGHISFVYDSRKNKLVARTTEHTKEKDVERLITYEEIEGNLIKKIYSENKNKRGLPLGEPKLKQWQFDKKNKEFSYLG